MKFKTIAEAYNHYKGMTLEQIETRAAEIKRQIETDANADVAALNIEAEGMEQAAAEKRDAGNGGQGSGVEFRGFNFLGGAAFGGQASKEATEGDVFASVEYRNAFYKQLMGRQLTQPEKAAFERAQAIVKAENRASDFNTVTESAAVVPTSTLNEIVKKARTIGGIMPHCRGFNMPSKIAIPVGTPGTKAAWHTEGAAVDAEQHVPASVTFNGYEIIKIFSISAATKAMTVAAFESYLVDELTACVMETIADALVNGTGSAQGTGILTGVTFSASNKNLVTGSGTSGAITYADVVAAVAMLKRGYSAGAKWAMNNATLYNVFYGMVDGNKRPIFIADPKAENIGKILGFEVVVDDNMPANTVVFGNFHYMGYNMPQGIVVETSRESSFRSGLIDYRALAVADCKPIVTEAFVKLTVGSAS